MNYADDSCGIYLPCWKVVGWAKQSITCVGGGLRCWSAGPSTGLNKNYPLLSGTSGRHFKTLKNPSGHLHSFKNNCCSNCQSNLYSLSQRREHHCIWLPQWCGAVGPRGSWDFLKSWVLERYSVSYYLLWGIILHVDRCRYCQTKTWF